MPAGQGIFRLESDCARRRRGPLDRLIGSFSSPPLFLRQSGTVIDIGNLQFAATGRSFINRMSSLRARLRSYAIRSIASRLSFPLPRDGLSSPVITGRG